MEVIKDKIEIPNKSVENRRADGTFGPGNIANPTGRPKGKTLKEWAREKLMNMTDEQREDFIKTLPREIVWRMAEGNPKQDTEYSGEVKIKQSIYGGKSVQGLTGNEADIQPEAKN